MATERKNTKERGPHWSIQMAGVAALLAVLWAVYVHYFPRQQESPRAPPQSHQNAIVTNGGVAVNADGTSHVNVTQPPNAGSAP